MSDTTPTTPTPTPSSPSSPSSPGPSRYAPTHHTLTPTPHPGGPTPADIAGHQSATLNGGIRGAVLGAVLSTGVHLALRKKPAYANFGPGPKAFGYVCVVVPCISISAEKAGEAFERSKWTGVGKQQLDRQAAMREERWERMSQYERAAAWGKANKWTLIGGAWVGSLGIAFALVARTPQTFSQKLVQARMWAQGLTVGTLLSSALIAGASTSGNKVVEGKQDHSWADLLEQEGELKQEDVRRIREGQKQQAVAQR